MNNFIKIGDILIKKDSINSIEIVEKTHGKSSLFFLEISYLINNIRMISQQKFNSKEEAEKILQDMQQIDD
jgi:hypothetical protein